MSDELTPLSDREMEILRLVATGATNQQVALELAISINTVKVHLRNIFAKLEVGSRTEATMVAVRQGWVEVLGKDKLGDQDEPLDGTAVEQPPLDLSQPEGRARVSVTRRTAIVAGLLLAIAIILLPLLLQTLSNNGGSSPSEAALSTSTAAAGASTSRWRTRAQMPTPRTGLAIVEYDGLVYTIGGEADDGVTQTVEVYDPQADLWSALRAKPTAAGYVSAAVIDGIIYVPGGIGSGESAQDVLEIYSPESNTWTTGAPMPEPLGAYGLAAFEDRVYVLGGFDGQKYADSVYRYDPVSDSWEELAPMDQARGYLGAATVGDRIYVAGGYDGVVELDSCAAYSPGNDAWSPCAPMLQGRGGLALVPVRETLYAIGGGMDSYLEFNERYDPRTDAWTGIETPFTKAWQGLAATFVSPYIYAMGGQGEAYLAANEAYRALYIVVVP